MAWYLDTSAFLKLLIAEDETAAMRGWFDGRNSVWSSQLLRTETHRAARRAGVPPEAVDGALGAVSLVLPSAATFRVAGTLQPETLRPLDALHLATALELGDELQGLVTYDQRMIEGATAASVDVVHPA